MAVASGCGPADPHADAAAADARDGGGVYTWLADHDPSALVVVDGLSAPIAARVAPDARVATAPNPVTGCALARRTHTLLAVRAVPYTKARDAAEDCGFAIFHDDRSLVVAPR